MSRPIDTLDASLVDLAARLAIEAGQLVRRGRFERGVGDAATKSTVTDVVTEFDRMSEAHILRGISAARPHDAVTGEEGTSKAGSSGVSWLVDPIDGTTNFTYGYPGYCVSIAAAVDGVTRAGVVYLPATDELFTASLGGGARLDGRAITCSATTDLNMTLVATGFSYVPTRRAAQGARIAALLPRIRDIRRSGAAASDLCHVAAGRVDAYFEEWLGPWDHAAGSLIAREAGCTVGDIGARAQADESAGPGLLVATPGVFDDLRRLIDEVDARLASEGGASGVTESRG